MDTTQTEFKHSVRGNYTGRRHVTAWFKYHKAQHNWQPNKDYICVGSEQGCGDWLLTDKAADECLLSSRHDLASDDTVSVGDEFVYVATTREGTVKIGFTRYIQSRMQKLRPKSYIAVQCRDAYNVEQSLHLLYAPHRVKDREHYDAEKVNIAEVVAVAEVLSKHRVPTKVTESKPVEAVESDA